MTNRTEDNDLRNENNSDEVSLEEKKKQIVEAIGKVSPDFSQERSEQLRDFYSDILVAHIAWLKSIGKI